MPYDFAPGCERFYVSHEVCKVRLVGFCKTGNSACLLQTDIVPVFFGYRGTYFYVVLLHEFAVGVYFAVSVSSFIVFGIVPVFFQRTSAYVQIAYYKFVACGFAKFIQVLLYGIFGETVAYGEHFYCFGERTLQTA